MAADTDETATPLRVHADVVPPVAITGQLLHVDARRDAKILHGLRRMDQPELLQCRSLHRSVDAFDVLRMTDPLGAFVSERSDHENWL